MHSCSQCPIIIGWVDSAFLTMSFHTETMTSTSFNHLLYFRLRGSVSRSGKKAVSTLQDCCYNNWCSRGTDGLRL